MKKILLIGGSGQVGSELKAQSKLNGFECLAPTSQQLDVTDSASIRRYLEKNTDVNFVINASAYTAVDKAESEQELAYQVNAIAPGGLAAACCENNIPLLHISTDYVFDGTADSPYTESSPVNPINVYGKSKREGEQAVQNACDEFIILRTSWVFGVNGHNFVKTMLGLGRTRPEISVVADQYGCPTEASYIARTIFEVIKSILTGKTGCWGVYHYSGSGVTDWSSFAQAIFEQARKVNPAYPEVTVNKITTADYPTSALRPGYTALDCSRIEEVFAVRGVRWQEMLDSSMAAIYENAFEQK